MNIFIDTNVILENFIIREDFNTVCLWEVSIQWFS